MLHTPLQLQEIVLEDDNRNDELETAWRFPLLRTKVAESPSLGFERTELAPEAIMHTGIGPVECSREPLHAGLEQVTHP